MMEQIGVGAADLGGDRLQCDGLRPVGQKQAPGRFERDGTAFLGGEALAAY
jgi:hypothetical protein